MSTHQKDGKGGRFATIAKKISRPFKTIGRKLERPFEFVKGIIEYLGDHDWGIYSAGLAFYALLALTPFVILAVVIGGAVFGSELAQAGLHNAIAAEAGLQVADLVVGFAEGAADLTSLSIASVFALVLLIWSSTNLLTQVRSGLHEMFGIEPPAESQGGVGKAVLKFLRYRLFAALGTLAFGALFIALLGSRLALSLIEKGSAELLDVPIWVWDIADIVVALVFITVAVRIVYWLLPDRRPVGLAPWIGGLITAVLLVLGRTGVALYLSVGSVSTAYGAAGALVVFLGWAYWSAYVFLLGARVTWVLAERAALNTRAPFPPVSEAAKAEAIEQIENPPPPTQMTVEL